MNESPSKADMEREFAFLDRLDTKVKEKKKQINKAMGPFKGKIGKYRLCYFTRPMGLIKYPFTIYLLLIIKSLERANGKIRDMGNGRGPVDVLEALPCA